ncbi:MAG: hypothetical protein C0410_12600 [Anaerolinea sp.]|nr:hypothetical protein [Anaerolinea sp.]
MKCLKCGFENLDNAGFCSRCGEPFSSPPTDLQIRYCSKCGNSNNIQAKYCKFCGTSLTTNSDLIVQSGLAPQGQKQKVANQYTRLFVIWLMVGIFITVYIIVSLLFSQRQKFLSGGYTGEAKVIASQFVNDNYQDFSDIEPIVYFANVQGKDFYVADFISIDQNSGSEGLRVLVDPFLRAVYAYEHIYQGESNNTQTQSILYFVISGDTCTSIAVQFGIAVEQLIAINNLPDDCGDLVQNQQLIIPLSSE